jgi:hypothetical protein
VVGAESIEKGIKAIDMYELCRCAFECMPPIVPPSCKGEIFSRSTAAWAR